MTGADRATAGRRPRPVRKPVPRQSIEVDAPLAPGRNYAVSEVARAERMVLFTTAAHRAPSGGGWIVPIHGRVFEAPSGRAAKAALALALKTGFGVSPAPASRLIFDERCSLMLADSKRGRRVVVTVAGADHQLAPTDRYGHFRGAILLPDAMLARLPAKDHVEIAARLAPRDQRRFVGRALLVAPAGLSVISDIDDTVKITHVDSRRRMMASTFLEAFEAVAGMAERYRGWVSGGAALHFISSSPWPLYEPLEAFLAAAGFPQATATLKNVALKDRSIRNLLAKATKTKPPAIDALLRDFPGRRFVLVGDSTENDAEIYADIARRHGARIAKVLIRDSGGRRSGLERAREALAPLDADRWQIFRLASELPVTLS